MNNTINYNPVTKMKIDTIDKDDDNNVKNIEIDNEEKILKTDEHTDFSQNNGENMEGNYNSDYGEITSSKNENEESINYMKNYN